MAVLDADFGTDLTPAEGGDTLWSLPMVAPACEPLDWASLLEEAEARVKEERSRANVAELRREELRRSERDARALANSLTRQLDTCRFKLKAAATKTASRATKALESRVESQDGEIADLQLMLRRSHERRERIEERHQDEINGLKQDIDRERSQIAKVYRKGERVAESLRKQFDRQLAAARRLVEAREGTIAWLRERNDRLRAAIVRATELIAALREKNARLRGEVRDLKCENAALASRVETLQADLDKLRSTRSVLSKALYGSRSERQKKPGTGRKRGQQRGAAGHGRTQRPGLRQKKEPRDPPEDARVCPRCGMPYAANGERCTTLVEIEVEAYENTIVRPRYRRGCDCASSPREVTAPPVTRLFETTPYGISVWACMLYERFVCCRPLHRVAAWLADMGLAISPGTLADSIKRFVPLFEPLAEAILAHQNEAALRHADETSWRVQAYREKGRSSRAWLWTFRNGAVPVKLHFSIADRRDTIIRSRSLGACGRLYPPGVVRRSFRGHRGTGSGLDDCNASLVLRRNHDPGCVRRQALASVRGQRGGCQLHAWSKTIPECQSQSRARTRWYGSATRPTTCIIGNRVPARGHRWIAHLQARLFPPC